MSKSCNHSGKCGCKDSALTIPPNYITDPAICPDPEECSELFDMNCICYNGDPIVELDINPGDRMNELIQKLVLAITNPGCAQYGDPLATCKSVLNFESNVITDNSISVVWDLEALGLTYQLEYKETVATTWLINPSLGPTINADTAGGLLPDTWYDLRVNTFCTTGSCYSVTIRIKTLPIPTT